MSNSRITGKNQLYGTALPCWSGLTHRRHRCFSYLSHPFRCVCSISTHIPVCFLKRDSGIHLLSHAVSSIVSSAVQVLTIVFGMGTGVSPARIDTGNVVLKTQQYVKPLLFFPRKEVIQPHLPIRLPCYDFTPVIGPAFDSSLLSVGSLASGVTDSHGVTGGVYKTRERIHRDMLIRDY